MQNADDDAILKNDIRSFKWNGVPAQGDKSFDGNLIFNNFSSATDSSVKAALY